MEIRIKALKCEAGEKLTQFVEKKVARLGKFFDGVAQQAEVTGEELIIDRVADTFENAITECVDAMKEKLTRSKEKKYDM